MEAVVSSIEERCSDELEKLFGEGDKHGVGSKLRGIWRNDKQRKNDDFMSDQLRNSKQYYLPENSIKSVSEIGRRSNRWSSIMLRIGKVQ